MAQTTPMEGLENGSVTSLKRPWPFELEPFEQVAYNFDPQPATEPLQNQWYFNQIWDQNFLDPGANYHALDQINQGNGFGQALDSHVTIPAAPLQSILNQEYGEKQVPLEMTRKVCFGSVLAPLLSLLVF
jgi:hypothetical protein